MSDAAEKVAELNGKPLETAVAAPTENPTNPTIQGKPEETVIELYKYNPKTVAKFVEAFNNSYNITEACQYAGVDRDTYYRWYRDIAEFTALIDEAKSMPLRKSKEVITKAIVDGDIQTAKWYTERRDPDFKPKAELENNVGLQETRKKIGDFLDDDDSPDDVGEQPTATDANTPADEMANTPTDIS